MLKKEVAALLEQQINKEFYSAYLYLDMSNYYYSKNLDGFGNWFKIQAQEERDHAMLFLTYLQNNGECPKLGAIDAPDKAEYVARLRREGHTVLMVGDGINDSPALSEADAGIAISDGAAIAREIADITIAADSLWELVELRRIAMALMARIHSNYRFVIGFNGALIALGVAGVLPPATSATLHNLSTLGVSLRSMSALPLSKKNTP